MVLCGVLFAIQLVSAVVLRVLVFLFPLCIVTINQMIYNLIFTGPKGHIVFKQWCVLKISSDGDWILT